MARCRFLGGTETRQLTLLLVPYLGVDCHLQLRFYSSSLRVELPDSTCTAGFDTRVEAISPPYTLL